MDILVIIALAAYVYTWNKYYKTEHDAGNKTNFKNYIQYLQREYLGRE